MVEFKVTHSKFGKEEFADCIEAPDRSTAIASWLHEYSDSRLDESALITLLFKHDDLRIATPTWELHFEQSFRA